MDIDQISTKTGLGRRSLALVAGGLLGVGALLGGLLVGFQSKGGDQVAPVSVVTAPTAPIAPVWPASGTATLLAALDAQQSSQFLQQVFGASVQLDLGDYVELTVNGGAIWVANEEPAFGFLSPATSGSYSDCIMVTVDNVDEATDRAVGAGARVLQPPTNQEYGVRDSRVQDPSGHLWLISQVLGSVSVAELESMTFSRHYR